MLITWKPEFELGVQAMDDTHREFVDLLNALNACSDFDLPPTMMRFIDHTIAHFEQEYRWMTETGFPPITCHHREHERVLRVLCKVRDIVDAGTLAVGRALIVELPLWFAQHAATMDAMLAWHLKQYGHATSCPQHARQAITDTKPTGIRQPAAGR